MGSLLSPQQIFLSSSMTPSRIVAQRKFFGSLNLNALLLAIPLRLHLKAPENTTSSGTMRVVSKIALGTPLAAGLLLIGTICMKQQRSAAQDFPGLTVMSVLQMPSLDHKKKVIESLFVL